MDFITRWFVVENLIQANWEVSKITDAIDYSEDTIINDIKMLSEDIRMLSEGTTKVVFPKSITFDKLRSWKKFAELALAKKLDEKHEALKTALEKLLGWNIAVAEFESGQRILRELMVPDISALPEWQQRLVRDLWPDCFCNLPAELCTRDLLKAIKNETIDFLDDGDPNIEKWLIQKTEIHRLICTVVDDSWIQTIKETIWQLPKRKVRLVNYFYKNLGTVGDKNIYEKTAYHFKMKPEIVRRHLSECQDALREELKSVELLIALIPLAAQTEELERIIRVREEEERRARS